MFGGWLFWELQRITGSVTFEIGLEYIFYILFNVIQKEVHKQLMLTLKKLLSF